MALRCREPFEIVAGEGESSAGESGEALVVAAATVEAQDGAVVCDGDVRIHAGTGFECFIDGPGLGFVATELDADVFAIAGFAWLGLAFGFVEVVGI